MKPRNHGTQQRTAIKAIPQVTLKLRFASLAAQEKDLGSFKSPETQAGSMKVALGICILSVNYYIAVSILIIFTFIIYFNI